MEKREKTKGTVEETRYERTRVEAKSKARKKGLGWKKVQEIMAQAQTRKNRFFFYSILYNLSKVLSFYSLQSFLIITSLFHYWVKCARVPRDYTSRALRCTSHFQGA